MADGDRLAGGEGILVGAEEGEGPATFAPFLDEPERLGAVQSVLAFSSPSVKITTS